MTEGSEDIEFGVAEAKARFSELIDRVAKGERFQITKRGRRVVELVRPGEAPRAKTDRVGLAALAGVLADWDELPAVVEQIYEARRASRDRRVPEVD
jgi:antitoxin (DNA-binding transcriptional repressor) of toxin-antitoxin stability system